MKRLGCVEMVDHIKLSVLISLVIYLTVRLVIHFIEFFKYVRIKEELIVEAYTFISSLEDKYSVEIAALSQALENTVDRIKCRQYIDDIIVTWIGSDKLKMSIVMDYGKRKPKFDFMIDIGEVINIKEIDGR